ncbi:hypothetical protein DL98DRAFT_591854 [Cadophora sp. DSE1049]|nr:hypothetical protein DL98DRAFT_591854 [Cadophora sp. DSE1049]
MDLLWDRINDVNMQYMKLNGVLAEDMAMSMEQFRARQRPDFNVTLENERPKIVNSNRRPAEKKADVPQSSSVQTEWGAVKPKSRPENPVSQSTPEVETMPDPTPLPPIAVKQQS